MLNTLLDVPQARLRYPNNFALQETSPSICHPHPHNTPGRSSLLRRARSPRASRYRGLRQGVSLGQTIKPTGWMTMTLWGTTRSISRATTQPHAMKRSLSPLKIQARPSTTPHQKHPRRIMTSQDPGKLLLEKRRIHFSSRHLSRPHCQALLRGHASHNPNQPFACG